MRKPPAVDDGQKDRALAAIHRRHHKDDTNYDFLLSEDPLEVLTYLRKLGTHGLRGDAESHDVEDALILRLWLWWQGERHEVWLLDQVDQLGLNRRTVGARLGVRTSQGLVDRREYKRRLVTGGAEAATPAATPDDPDPARQRWLTAHRGEIRAIAATLDDHRHLADDEAAEWLVEVRSDLRAGACTPGSFAYLGWAVEAMQDCADVVVLPDSHPLLQALGSWKSIAAAYNAVP